MGRGKGKWVGRKGKGEGEGKGGEKDASVYGQQEKYKMSTNCKGRKGEYERKKTLNSA